MNEQELKYELAKKYYNNKDYEKAAVLAENLRWQDPLNTDYLLLTGNINYAMQKNDWAVGAYSRALMFDPFNCDAHLGLALAYIQKGSAKHAVESLKFVVAQSTQPELKERAKTLLELLHEQVN